MASAVSTRESVREEVQAPEPDEVFLTGATGFIGGHVLTALLERGYRVRALARGDPGRLEPRPGLTVVSGDLLDGGSLAALMRGCRYLVHAAALYTFQPRDRALVWRTNVDGTVSVLEAARIAGIERAVITSSSAVVGPARGHKPTEADRPPLPSRHGGYHASKAWQEVAALAAQVPCVAVLPTAPVGPGDAKPTPTGQMILDFMQGRMRATVDGGMNLVAVEAVAAAHVAALERGRLWERYLVGGEDLTFDEIWDLLSELTGRQPPKLRLPHFLVGLLARLDDLRCRLLRGRPRVPLEGAEMARHLMYAVSEKAERELGYRPGPAKPPLERAVTWYGHHARAG